MVDLAVELATSALFPAADDDFSGLGDDGWLVLAGTSWCPLSPLLEEEGDVGGGALVAEAACPVGMHFAGFGAGFTSADDPVNGASNGGAAGAIGLQGDVDGIEVEIDLSQQGLAAQEPYFGWDVEQVRQSLIGGGLIFDAGADPDVVWHCGGIQPVPEPFGVGFAPCFIAWLSTPIQDHFYALDAVLRALGEEQPIEVGCIVDGAQEASQPCGGDFFIQPVGERCS